MGNTINLLEVKRQTLHVLVGMLTLFLLIIGQLTPMILFWLIVVSYAFSILSKRYDVPVVHWFLKHFEREKDMQHFPGKGFVSFFVGVLLTVKLFEPQIAYASIMVVTLGDTVSHLIGTHFGRIKHPLNGLKSLEGNLIGGLAGFIGAIFFIEPLYAAIGSFGAMTIEAVQIRMNRALVDDNIIVPLVCGALILLARAYL